MEKVKTVKIEWSKQDSPGLPSPILKIIYWTKDVRKLEAINKIVRKF